MPSDNLNISLVTTSQNQKELTINDAINAIDNALNASLDITITTDRTLTTDEFTRNVIFNLTGTPVAGFEFVIPATERLFAVRNNTGQTATVKYAASGSFPVSDGDAALIHSNGTDIIALGGGGGAGASAFTGLSDVPSSYTGHSLKSIRVNAAETGLEFFVPSAAATAFLGLTDTPSSFSGAALYKVRVNAGATALEFIEDVATSGTDVQARAGATRFVVPGTYADPSSTDISRNALEVAGFTSSDARALNAAITGLAAIDEMSGYVEINFATLPATGNVAILYAENFSAGDSLIWLAVKPDGSIVANVDRFFTETSSATGVITAATNHKVAMTVDFSAAGQPVKVFVDGVNVISDVMTADVVPSATNVTYRVGAFGPATADGAYSRAAIWSGLLSDAEAIALTNAGDPQGFSPASAVLRAYWLLDEGTGTTAAATVGGVDLTLTGSGAGWATISGPAASGTIVRVAASSATGDFATHENDLALKTDAGWTFLVPVEGWNVYDQTDNDEDQWSGSAWVILPSGTFTGGTLTSALNEAPATTLASAGSLDIGAEAANTINITGTTTITALGTIADGATRRLVFAGILTLTHNGTSLILPTGANITTAAGDVAEFISLGAGNWKCVDYQRADGTALVGGTSTFEIGTFLGGLQLANTLVFKHVFAQASTFPDDFAGAILQADFAAAASKVYDLRKNGASIGSATVAISGTSATFTTTGGATSFAIGDRLEIITPAVQDTTLADVSISLLGTKD